MLYPSKRPSGLYGNLEDTRKGLLAFVAQLKAGKGLTLVAECMEGQFAQMAGTEMEKIREVHSIIFEFEMLIEYFRNYMKQLKQAEFVDFVMCWSLNITLKVFPI